MKIRNLTIWMGLGLGVVLVLGILLVVRSEDEDVAAETEHARGTRLAVPRFDLSAATGGTDESPNHLGWIESLREEVDSRSVDEFAGFLEGHDYGPRACAAVFDITGDLDHLRESIERHPEDRGLLLRLAINGTRDERTSIAQQVISLFPNDASGYYLAMKWDRDDPGAGAFYSSAASWHHDAKLLEKAVGCGIRPIDAPMDAILRKDALVRLGIDASEAKVAASTFSDFKGSDMFMSSRQAATIRLLSSSDVLQTKGAEERTDFLLTAAAACEHLSMKAANSLFALASASGAKIDILSMLDPEIPYGEDGTVASELEQARTHSDEWKNLLALDYVHLSDADSEFYYERFLAEGEVPALRALAKRLNVAVPDEAR